MCGSAWRGMEWLCLRLDDSERWSYYKWSSIRRIINFFETLKTVSDIFDRLKGAERLRETTQMRSWRNSMAPQRGWETERDHSDEKLEEQYGTSKGLRDWERSLRWEAGGTVWHLKGAERLREITPMRSWRNSMAPRCISQERNHSVLSAISILVWKYFSLWLSCEPLCVMLGCDALIITCHFSFPSHSFTSAFFSFYLWFFLHSRWPDVCSFLLSEGFLKILIYCKIIIHLKIFSYLQNLHDFLFQWNTN